MQEDGAPAPPDGLVPVNCGHQVRRVPAEPVLISWRAHRGLRQIVNALVLEGYPSPGKLLDYLGGFSQRAGKPIRLSLRGRCALWCGLSGGHPGEKENRKEQENGRTTIVVRIRHNRPQTRKMILFSLIGILLWICTYSGKV